MHSDEDGIEERKEGGGVSLSSIDINLANILKEHGGTAKSHCRDDVQTGPILMVDSHLNASSGLYVVFIRDKVTFELYPRTPVTTEVDVIECTNDCINLI